MIALSGCLEYSPHALPLDHVHRDMHRKSLEQLLATPEPEVLRFAIVGDTQGDFSEAEKCVAQLNERDDLSLAIQVGDFTHQGVGPEYKAMNSIFRRLRVPHFVVVGNHDLLANGGDIYDRMFGERNLAFTYARTRFVLFDSNGVEYGWGGKLPDLDLVRRLLEPDGTFDRAILVSHIDPSSPDWDPVLREPYYDLVREFGVEVSFYGHGHTPHEFERDGSRFYLPGAVDWRTYIIAAIHPDGRIDVERRHF
jgi:3',5'-cyclic-AMP phosphodiesterase